MRLAKHFRETRLVANRLGSSSSLPALSFSVSISDILPIEPKEPALKGEFYAIVRIPETRTALDRFARRDTEARPRNKAVPREAVTAPAREQAEQLAATGVELFYHHRDATALANLTPRV